MASGKWRVTNREIYLELKSISDTLEKHTKADADNFGELRKLLEGTDAAPGMKIRVDRLEQSELSKQRHLKGLWSLLVGLIVAVVASFLR